MSVLTATPRDGVTIHDLTKLPPEESERAYREMIGRLAKQARPLNDDDFAEFAKYGYSDRESIRSEVRETRISRREKALATIAKLPELGEQVVEAKAEAQKLTNELAAIEKRNHTPWEKEQLTKRMREAWSVAERLTGKYERLGREARETLQDTADPGIRTLQESFRECLDKLRAGKPMIPYFDRNSAEWKKAPGGSFPPNAESIRQEMMSSLEESLARLSKELECPSSVVV